MYRSSLLNTLSRQVIQFFFIVFFFFTLSCDDKKQNISNEQKQKQMQFMMKIAGVKLFYQKFNTAKIEGDTEYLYKSLDSLSKNYFDELLKKVWYTDNTEFYKLSPYDQINILYVRSIVDKDSILNFTGKDLVGVILDKSSESEEVKKQISDTHFQKVQLNNTTAEGLLNTNEIIKFSLENNQWRINYVTHIVNLNAHYGKQLSGSSKSDNEVFQRMLNGQKFKNAKIRDLDLLLIALKEK